MTLAEAIGGLGEVRLEDVAAFLEIYERCKTLAFTERTTFAALFGDGSAYSTVAGQLGRVAAFAARHAAQPGGQHGSRRQPRRTGLELLFARTVGGGAGLEPTEVAKALYEEFLLLRDVCENLGLRVSGRLGREPFPRDVRIGASQNMGHFILPYCLSNWKDCFGSTVRLSLEVNHTSLLLPRLDAGLLDFVLSYGRAYGKGIAQQEPLRVAFSAFDPEFTSQFILTCPPRGEVRMANGQDANKGNWDRVWRKYTKENNPDLNKILDELTPLDPDQIDFRGTVLIVSPTWDPPPGIAKLEKRAEAAGATILYVNSYEEAAARVRCNLGLAVLPQVFSTRQMLAAFRLEPSAAFLRWIGAYYSTRYPMSEEAYKVLAFISSYMDKFRGALRAGHPVGLHDLDSEYPQWSSNFRVEGDWRESANRDYPLPRKRSGRKKKGSSRPAQKPAD